MLDHVARAGAIVSEGGAEHGRRLVERDRAHLWHPYTQHGIVNDPVAVVGAAGAYLHVAGGPPVLDAISSWWVTVHGHAHPVIADAIARQARELEHVIFAGFTHEPAVRLAEELVRVLPDGLSRVFYSDDGSTAVEVALKMALQYWRNQGEKRNLVAALEHAYHGDTFGAMGVGARGVFTAPFADHLMEVARLGAPDERDTLAELDALLDARGRELAAVIVEPMLLGAGGMRMYGDEVLRGIRDRTAARGVLLIADEVLTGFGRTGPLFACGGAGVTPDLICLSKGLSGGALPLGATIATERVFDAFRSSDRARTLFHGHSFTANPIACAAALASLSLFDSDCEARRLNIERWHRAHLDQLKGDLRVGNSRVLGTVAAFDLPAERDGGYLDPIGRALGEFALKENVLIRPLGNVVYLMPPYCVTASDVAVAYGVIERFLASR